VGQKHIWPNLVEKGEHWKNYDRFKNNKSSYLPFETSPRALKFDQSTLDTTSKHDVYYFTYDYVYSNIQH
jgi:hypothetical protein